eukprot:COSAG02_NODE_4689_length_5091_cov_1.795072_1_plen_64_part_00
MSVERVSVELVVSAHTGGVAGCLIAGGLTDSVVVPCPKTPSLPPPNVRGLRPEQVCPCRMADT